MCRFLWACSMHEVNTVFHLDCAAIAKSPWLEHFASHFSAMARNFSVTASVCFFLITSLYTSCRPIATAIAPSSIASGSWIGTWNLQLALYFRFQSPWKRWTICWALKPRGSRWLQEMKMNWKELSARTASWLCCCVSRIVTPSYPSQVTSEYPFNTLERTRLNWFVPRKCLKVSIQKDKQCSATWDFA